MYSIKYFVCHDKDIKPKYINLKINLFLIFYYLFRFAYVFDVRIQYMEVQIYSSMKKK